MIKLINNIAVNDKSKKITWLSRNYFFAVTTMIVLLNVILYAVHGSHLGDYAIRSNWGKFTVDNLFQALVNSYEHSNWQHCLLNMLCFFVAGIYLERKQGSLRFLIFMFIMSVFTAFAICTNDISLGWHGFSGVNYGLYGYIIVDYFFVLFQKQKRYPFNVIAGIVILGLIYFAMCFNGGTREVTFASYPYDLLHNLGHASGFIVGIIFGFYEMIVSIIQKHSHKNDTA